MSSLTMTVWSSAETVPGDTLGAAAATGVTDRCDLVTDRNRVGVPKRCRRKARGTQQLDHGDVMTAVVATTVAG